MYVYHWKHLDLIPFYQINFQFEKALWEMAEKIENRAYQKYV